MLVVCGFIDVLLCELEVAIVKRHSDCLVKPAFQGISHHKQVYLSGLQQPSLYEFEVDLHFLTYHFPVLLGLQEGLQLCILLPPQQKLKHVIKDQPRMLLV